MKDFKIFDAELSMAISILLYDEDRSKFIIVLRDNVDEWTALPVSDQLCEKLKKSTCSEKNHIKKAEVCTVLQKLDLKI